MRTYFYHASSAERERSSKFQQFFRGLPVRRGADEFYVECPGTAISHTKQVVVAGDCYIMTIGGDGKTCRATFQWLPWQNQEIAKRLREIKLHRGDDRYLRWDVCPSVRGCQYTFVVESDLPNRTEVTAKEIEGVKYEVTSVVRDKRLTETYVAEGISPAMVAELLVNYISPVPTDELGIIACRFAQIKSSFKENPLSAECCGSGRHCQYVFTFADDSGLNALLASDCVIAGTKYIVTSSTNRGERVERYVANDITPTESIKVHSDCGQVWVEHTHDSVNTDLEFRRYFMNFDYHGMKYRAVFDVSSFANAGIAKTVYTPDYVEKL